MKRVLPEDPQELAARLKEAGESRWRVCIEGGGTKAAWLGGAGEADLLIGAARMDKVLQYDPKDLTISVQAGMRFAELARLVAAEKQMLPLDPPFFERATVGGVVAANASGPRRRQYGTARDMVIGMRFARMNGQLVDCGGMVVKNVAGLDIGKLLIGSFGILGAITSVNFRLFPAPSLSRTFILSFNNAAEAQARRDEILAGVLQPCAIDALNPGGAKRIGREGFLLLVRAEGMEASLDRFSRELSGAEAAEGESEEALWRNARELAPDFLASCPEGVVVKASFTLSETGAVLESSPHPAIARAGNGVAYLCFPTASEYRQWKEECSARPWKHVVELARTGALGGSERWPAPGGGFVWMEKVKQLFDPGHLLNRGRLYERL